MRRLFGPALVLGLAACYSPVGVPIGAGADPDEIPRSVVLADDVAEAEARVRATLRALGLRESGDVWRRRLPEDEDWAYCRPLRFEENDNYETVLPDDGAVDVEWTVATTEGGTRVTIDPSFVGVYRAPGLAGTVRRPCNSFGVFETRFVERLKSGD